MLQSDWILVTSQQSGSNFLSTTHCPAITILVCFLSDERRHVEIVNPLVCIIARKFFRRARRVSRRRGQRHLRAGRERDCRRFLTEPGRDHSDLHFVGHRLVDHVPKIMLASSSAASRMIDAAVVHFIQRQVRPAGDVDEHAFRALESSPLQAAATRSPAASLRSRDSRRARARHPSAPCPFPA